MKEEYLNIISDEIQKNEELLNDTNNTIAFYEKMNDVEKVNELLKNKKLYESRIKYLKGIEKLPLYLKITNMTHKEFTLYKDTLISNIDKTINELNDKLKELNNYTNESNNEINSKYELYKETNDEQYVEESKYLLNCIKTYKNEIEAIKELLTNLGVKKGETVNLTKKDLINKLVKEYNLSNIEDELNVYTPDKIDRLVVPMCSELDILDEIVPLMKKYTDLEKNKTYETMVLPRILNDYTFDDSYISSLNWFSEDLNAKLNDTILEIYGLESFDIISENIEYAIDKLNKDEGKLEYINNILELFPDNIEKYQLSDLKLLANKILQSEESNSRIIKNMDNKLAEICELKKQLELLDNKFQTEKVLLKIKNISTEIEEKTKEAIDLLWCYLTNEIDNILERITSDYVFNSDIDYLDINDNNEKIIIENDNYSNLNLYNTRVFILKTLEKYNDLISELNKLKEINNENKINFIKKEETRNTKLNNVNKKIKELYSRVSDEIIEEYDYNKIINVFRNNTIIESIVRVERENLINKIKNNNNNINMLKILDMNKEITYKENEPELNNKKAEKTEEKEVPVRENIGKESRKEHTNITKEEKIQKEKLDIEKIKAFIEKLGIDNETLKEIFKNLLSDEYIINNIFNLDRKGTINKEKARNIIKGINVYNYNTICELIVDLYDNLELTNKDFMYMASQLLNNKVMLINILKSNKKILFNALKNDVIKKILKK